MVFDLLSYVFVTLLIPGFLKLVEFFVLLLSA